MTRRMLTLALAAILALSAAGCAAADRTAKTMVQQGVETTSTGPHTVVPANTAAGAVDAINGASQQTQDAQQQNTGQ